MTLRAQTREQVATRLAGGALGPSSAMVVPLKPGRKHVLPAAAWGQVSVEDAGLPWGEPEAALMRVVLELRAHGFGSRMLGDPAPAMSVLRTLPRDRWVSVLTAWEHLAPWRRDTLWLSLALRVSTPSQSPVGADGPGSTEASAGGGSREHC